MTKANDDSMDVCLLSVASILSSESQQQKNSNKENKKYINKNNKGLFGNSGRVVRSSLHTWGIDIEFLVHGRFDMELHMQQRISLRNHRRRRCALS